MGRARPDSAREGRECQRSYEPVTPDATIGPNRS